MGGGDFLQQSQKTIQSIKKTYPNQAIKKSIKKTETFEIPQKQTLAHVEAKPKTDSFIKVVSNVPWWGIGLGVICLVIGGLVVTILLLKLTPLGKIISKAWNGLRAMFDALIKWKPKGK